MNRFIKIIFLFLVFKCKLIQGQTFNWERVDTLIKGGYVDAIFEDTTDHSIYVGGMYYRIDTDTIIGIGRYKNGQWYRMGDGVDWPKDIPWCTSCFPSPVRDIIKYKDTIYITGSFSISGNETINGIAKWGGTSWLPIGSGLMYSDNNSGGGSKFKIFNNELYLVGAFDSIAGISAHSLAKYDGLTWQSVHNLPVISPVGGNPNLIEDLEFYNNELYLTGVMYDNTSIFNVIKWNGTNWVNPGIGVYGISNTSGLLRFKNELYLIGAWSHYANPNNLGNCIVKYDGTTWRDIGGGMIYSANYNASSIRSYAVDSNYLFVGGHFDICNGTRKINSIARYDGTKWCSLDTTYTTSYDVSEMQLINDTLYIGGYLGSQLMSSCFAYCKNYHFTDTCSAIGLGITELKMEKTITVYPNPSNGLVYISLNDKLVHDGEKVTVQVFDVQGRIILTKSVTKMQNEDFSLNLSQVSTGMYFIKLLSDNLNTSQKIIIQN